MYFSSHAAPPTAIYTLSLHDALPISVAGVDWVINMWGFGTLTPFAAWAATGRPLDAGHALVEGTRSEEHTLNSSHITISYAVFCLKKKKQKKFWNDAAAVTTHRANYS